MRKAELDAILRRDTGSIDLHLAALAHEPTLPALAVGACTLHIEEAEPALLGVLAKAAAREALSEADEATPLPRHARAWAARDDRLRSRRC